VSVDLVVCICPSSKRNEERMDEEKTMVEKDKRFGESARHTGIGLKMSVEKRHFSSV